MKHRVLGGPIWVGGDSSRKKRSRQSVHLSQRVEPQVANVSAGKRPTREIVNGYIGRFLKSFAIGPRVAPAPSDRQHPRARTWGVHDPEWRCDLITSGQCTISPALPATAATELGNRYFARFGRPASSLWRPKKRRQGPLTEPEPKRMSLS